MHKKAGLRLQRLLLGGLALLLVSLAFKVPRSIVPGAQRRDPRPLPSGLVKHTPEGELILPAAAHESADIGSRFIGGAFALLLLSLVLVTLGVLWLFPLPGTDRTLHSPLPIYPEPRLQPSPRQEMQRFLAAEREQLTTYGWVDRAHGIVRIPIEAAMRRVAKEGIPDWPADADPAAGTPMVAAGRMR
jgi:hypothetical protein